jgi:hypothetical protein
VSLTLVQSTSSGGFRQASGVSFSMGSNVTPGNALALCASVDQGGTGLSAVSGLGAAWNGPVSKVQKGSGAAHIEWWIGIGCTGLAAITITTNAAQGYWGYGFEVSGLGSYLTGGISSGTSAPTLTFTGLSGGDLILAGAATQTVSGSPTSPWTNLLWNAGQTLNVAYQITSGSSNQTATYTTSAGNWGMAGLILSPASGGVTGDPIVMLI